MSRHFGPVRQNGYVVEDLDAAILAWTTLGVGPFFVSRHLPLDDFTYRGTAAAPDISVAFACSGDLEIELIEQHDQTPSPYLDFRLANGPGLHHVSAWTQTYDTLLTDLLEVGLQPECEGAVGGAVRFAYFFAGDAAGPVFEISDLGTDTEHGTVHQLIREAATEWDGHEPVRELPPPG